MKPLKVVICDSWWLEEEDYKEDLKKTLEELNVSFPIRYNIFRKNKKEPKRYRHAHKTLVE